MQIIPTFSFAAGATQADVNQFEAAVNTVITLYEQTFSNVNVTLNINYAYGESYSSVSNNQVVFQTMPNAGAGTFDLGRSSTQYNSFLYTTVVAKLKQDEQSTDQINAYATLPANSPFGSDTLIVSNAQQKALGLTGGGSTIGHLEE